MLYHVRNHFPLVQWLIFARRLLKDSESVTFTGLGVMMLPTVYPKKYAHGFVVLCFVVAMQSFIMNSHEVFIHIHQGCFAGTGAIVRLPQCQWSKPDGYGKISQCITTTKHSKAKTVCIFLVIYCCYGYPYDNYIFAYYMVAKSLMAFAFDLVCNKVFDVTEIDCDIIFVFIF